MHCIWVNNVLYASVDKNNREKTPSTNLQALTNLLSQYMILTAWARFALPHSMLAQLLVV